MALRAFTEQSREDIVKSMVNWSHSKQLWSFPKKKRFQDSKAECPQLAYQEKWSSITNQQIKFPMSTRKLFVDERNTPSSDKYHLHDQTPKNVMSFGLSRQKCIFSSYVPISLSGNPGPDKYQKNSQRTGIKFTMRPKTANHRNYFIQNKQKENAPGPFEYDYSLQKNGSSKIAKFRSVTLGGVGMMRTSARFSQFALKTPCAFDYEPKKVSLKNKSIGGRMGKSKRKSFIDQIKHNKFGPGPGNYQLPSQFGHYKATHSKRIVTIN